MKNKAILSALAVTFVLISCVIISHAGESTKVINYKPAQGYVPDAETAIKVAVAIWTPIYGKEQIEKEKPYKAILKDDVWYVSGSLPEGWLGGVAEAEIAKDSGCILKVYHTQ